jgi:hypothetical protein
MLLVLVAAGALALSACLTPAQPTVTPTVTRAPRPTFTNPPAASPTFTAAPSPTVSPTPVVPPTATASPTRAIAATPTVNPNQNPLTGLGVSNPALLANRPLHVCIDNDTGARPHYGLMKADLVYEYLMERFYNTRFTAVFWGQEAEHIGPMRSVRLVNLELAPQHDALIACQGGSNGTLWNIYHDGRAAYYEFFDYTYAFMDMNFATGYFSIYGRHSNPQVGTMLTETSTGLLRKWLASNGQEKTAKVAGFTFSAAGAAAPQAMAATSVSVPFPAECCGVEWTYDAASQRYLRTMNGEAHVDAASKERVSASNVIVVYAPYEVSNIDEGYGAMGYRIRLTGEGKVTVFRDGVAILATWKRAGLNDFMQIVDAQGKAVPLHPGNSWIEIVPDVDFKVTFK